MSKELKALQIIISNKGLNGIKEPVETIETALIDYEKQKDYYAKLLESVINDKEHKALEILKENIGLKISIDEDSVDEDTACLYIPLDNGDICIVGYVEGKDKIELLKEVLK